MTRCFLCYTGASVSVTTHCHGLGGICQIGPRFLSNGVLSGSVAVNSSVPQGSVLGPIMFISYTEDVSQHIIPATSDQILFVRRRQTGLHRRTCRGRQLCQTRAPGLYLMLRTGARPEDSSLTLVSLN